MSSDVRVSSKHARPHVVEAWHAELTVARDADDGFAELTYLTCTHNHDTSDAADKCARRIASLVARRQSTHADAYPIWVRENR